MAEALRKSDSSPSLPQEIRVSRKDVPLLVAGVSLVIIGIAAIVFSQCIPQISSLYGSLSSAAIDGIRWGGVTAAAIGIIFTASGVYVRRSTVSSLLPTFEAHSREWIVENLEAWVIKSKVGADRANRETARVRILHAYDDRMQKLNLAALGLTDLPTALGDLRELTQLDLQDNLLSKLPSELCYLSQLKELNLRKNRLEELPDQLDHLHSLESLHLDQNDFPEVPQVVFNMRNLQLLALNSNARLRALPQRISNLNKLTCLDISSCQFTEIPRGIFRLQELREFNISSNRIEVIPSEIGKLIQLERLRMAETQVSVLPAELFQLLGLKLLDIRNNTKLEELPVERGNLKLQEYYADTQFMGQIEVLDDSTADLEPSRLDRSVTPSLFDQGARLKPRNYSEMRKMSVT